MHIYYEKKKEKIRASLDGYISPIREELEKETGESYDEIFSETWKVYEERLLEHFPYIGGDRASGTRNLTGAYGFVALGIVLEERGIPLERWGELSTVAYERFFRKIPDFVVRLAGKAIRNEKLVTRMLKGKDEKNRKNAEANPGSFVTETQPPTEEYPVIYHTLHCPLAEFAEKQGLTRFMPYICNLDYAMFEVLRIPFYREKTCADGDGLCDFKMKPGAPIVPAWPCHAADPDDPLK